MVLPWPLLPSPLDWRDLGAAYLGTQGDIWDAHTHMALAGLGALIAVTVIAFINRRCQRDFGREWTESLKVGRG